MAATGRLYINGKEVGTVVLKSLADSWGFGDFTPNAAFAQFAPAFGKWSLLMHADDDERKLSDAASEELRRAEIDIDALRARLRLDEQNQWVELSQLNIDGTMIEWKVSRRREDSKE